MLRFISRAIGLIFALAIVTLTAAWLFLALPFFAPQRIDMAEKLLTKDLGRPVSVSGDAKLKFGKNIRLVMTDVKIASPTTDDIDLAVAEALELDLDPRDFLNGTLSLDNFKLNGLVLNFVTFEDGTKSWSSAPAGTNTPDSNTGSDTSANDERASGDDKPGPLDRIEVDISQSSIRIENRVTGFIFDLGVDDLTLKRSPELKGMQIAANGSLNNEPLKIDGSYSTEAPFSMVAGIATSMVQIDGNPVRQADGKGYTVRVETEIDEIGDMLEVLGLARTIEGRGSLSVDIGVDGPNISAEQFDVVADYSDGRQVKASGSVDDLVSLDGIAAVISARLYPEGQEPPKAALLRDIRITGFDIDLSGALDALDLTSVHVSTNAFVEDFRDIGQMSISKVRRTPEGKLEIQDLELQAGPVDAPYMQARGSIGDAVKLEHIDIHGTLKVPASVFFRSLGEDKARAFGSLDGEFVLKEEGDGFGIRQLTVETAETDLWTFQTDATLEKIQTLEGLDIKLSVGMDDPAGVLKAIGRSPVDSGPLRLSLELSGETRTYDSKINLTAGSTQAEISLNLKDEESGPIVRGALVSDRVVASEIHKAVAVFVQIDKQRKTPSDSPEVQPLVLTDDRVIQPLVLKDERVVQPLVLPIGDISETAGQFLSIDALATRLDVEFGIDIKQVVGAEDVSSVKSDLKVRNGKLSFGPLNIAHGGGYFNINAAMDVVKSPGVVAVNGATGGWDLGKIMSSMGASIGAQGILGGRFALSGSSASVDRFLRTMVGNADISMGKGRIDTSLLELAGLGVIPWLFSKDLRRGYEEIVCIEMPVRIDRGKIKSNNIVLETDNVQLVARGTIDVANDTISLRAEPRPVGRPLARSAVPVNVSGKLSDPKVDIHLGGSRAVRTDGADDMPTARKPCKPDISQLQ